MRPDYWVIGYEFENLLRFLSDSGFDWKLTRGGFEASLGEFRWSYDFCGAWVTTDLLRKAHDTLRADFLRAELRGQTP